MALGKAASRPLPPPEPEPPTPTPVPPVEAPTSPEPEPTPPPRPDAHEREGLPASVELVKRWGEERGDLHARVVRIELGLEGVEGHEKKVADARKFLSEIEAWLAEAEPFYEQAARRSRSRAWASAWTTGSRSTRCTSGRSAGLELTEKMLIAVMPDPDD